jgi:hypothetical protein
VHLKGVEMSEWNVFDFDPDRSPAISCTGLVFTVVSRICCLFQPTLTTVVVHSILWRRTLAVGDGGKKLRTSRRNRRSRCWRMRRRARSRSLERVVRPSSAQTLLVRLSILHSCEDGWETRWSRLICLSKGEGLVLNFSSKECCETTQYDA